MPLVVWGASLSLSRWLDKQWDSLSIEKGPVKSLELGSGTGLLGLFTISRLLKDNSDSSIIMTDMEDSSIDLIKENMKLNSLKDTEAKVSYLKWGQFDTIKEESSFDLIVGSDIIYSSSILECLA